MQAEPEAELMAGVALAAGLVLAVGVGLTAWADLAAGGRIAHYPQRNCSERHLRRICA